MKRYFRNYTTIYEPENTYFIEDLKTESDYVIQELKRLEKEKQKLEKYLSEISNRAIEVLKEETLKGSEEDCLRILKRIFMETN